jgi:hypothetical protein
MKPFKFQTFWKKYGNLVLGGLVFLFLINYCNQQSRYESSQSTSNREEQVVADNAPENGNKLPDYEELMRRRPHQEPTGPGSFFTMLLLLTFSFGLVWLLQQHWVKKYIRRWLPGKVVFFVTKAKDSVTGRRLLRISIINKTDEGLTFLPPNLIFRKWGDERKFRLKGSSQEAMFPLTLTSGTSHHVILDLEQFYEKIPDLKNSNRVGASVETTGQKEYRAFAWPRWLSWVFQ